jgi:hypothetical protein
MAARNPNHLKIILAIALNDIAQAIKDRMILGVIIGILLLILPSQLLPIILQNENTPLAVISGREPTALANALTNLPDTNAFTVNNLPDLQDAIASRNGNIIGLVLTEDFSVKVTTKEHINIKAYLTHWTESDDAAMLINHFEDKIHVLTDSPVEITIVDDQVYPDEDTRGSQVMFILQLVNAILTTSLVLVPYLMMVEKETHTLDVLLVSPASLSDLVIGKSLVGVFYSAIAVIIVLLLNIKIVAHWPLLLLSVLSGITFAVIAGLFIGLSFENFQQATFTMSIVVMIAMAPAFIKLILTVSLPKVLDTIVTWLPSGQLASLLFMSLMQSVNLQSAMLGLSSIWIANFILFGLTISQIRRQMK